MWTFLSQPVASTQALEQAAAGEASGAATQGIAAVRPGVTGYVQRQDREGVRVTGPTQASFPG